MWMVMPLGLLPLCGRCGVAWPEVWEEVPPSALGVASGEMEGLRVARGDRLGVKDGDSAEVKLESWLMGERGVGRDVSWLVRAEFVDAVLDADPLPWLGRFNIGCASTAFGGAFVMRGGGSTLFKWALIFACIWCLWGTMWVGVFFGLILSSFNFAISENTCAKGWYCGPQSSK